MIILTTVGFKELHDFLVAGKLFTIILVISRVGTVFYSLGTGAQSVFNGKVYRVFWRKRVENTLRPLKRQAWTI